MQYWCEGKTQSIYIHWPFCPYRCRYCPFVAFAGHEDYMASYTQALCKEIELFAQMFPQKKALKTMYIGGGTPSTWLPQQLLDTFGTLNNVFVFEKDAEITLEVNPGTVTQEKIAAWQSCGINRLSVGVQSINDTVLKQMGRFHTRADVERFFALTEGVFNNCSIDLILGLPGIDKNAWKKQLELVASWPIKHVSLYFLTVHEHTRLHTDLQKGLYKLPEEDDLISMYEETVEVLSAAGIEQYEVSNYAQKGFESRHNKVYWERKPYKGFGLGASSFDGSRRFTTTGNITKYLEGIRLGHTISEHEEALTDQQVRIETIMLGLRRREGLVREDIFRGLSKEECAAKEKQLALFIQEGLLEERAGRIVATLRGFLLENHIIGTLIV